MKKLLSLSVLLVAVALVACSKDDGGGAPNPYGYNNGYGTTPIDSRCGTNGAVGYNYMNYNNNGFYNGYNGHVPMNNMNCIPNGYIQGGNPYYFQMNFQYYLGTCDLRHAGRSQLCPPGYQCRQAFGSTGVCMRGY